MLLQPAYATFCERSAEHSLVPLSLTLPVDTETPVSLYQKLVGDKLGFMLESATPGKNFGRYSFLGRHPFARLTGYRDSTIIINEREQTNAKQGPPLQVLKEFLAAHSLANLDELPLFSGGAVGYVAYEATATWERIRGMSIADDLVLSDMLFCRELAVFDHLEHSVTFLYLADAKADDLKESYQKGSAALHAMAAALQEPLPAKKEQTPPSSAVQAPLTASSDDYCAKVLRAKEYIAAGDAFQIVLSQESRRPLDCHPFQLYRRLRRVNPSPYMFYLNFGQHQVLGASPERLVKLEDGVVSTHPIAGTRPRGANAAEDERLGNELKNDPKELAEHAMLVDLGRNDIGKVSLPGSVQVTRLKEVEHFSHVMHLVSEVTGKMRPDYGAVDALQACFPAGTVSGAPKARVMEIIHELEGDQRGVYAGAVGYLDFRGNMDTCIAIRTLAIESGEIILRAGAGIVADSLPEMEYQEVRHKSQAMIKALEGIE
ncbi:anthranilate synthase component I [Azotosporobacter soli]|uniref:anthranilate synthase component I n=1 Tax=Azotosporobacter soli TaxID=3055040 RepID=UPI0031FEDB6C